MIDTSDKLRMAASQSRSWLRAHIGLFLGLALFTVALVFFRGQWLLSNATLNPDEAELLAIGKRAQLDLIPYQTYSTSTYLFLWPMFMGVLGIMGIHLTLPTAHFLSGLFYEFIAFTGWYLISLQYGRRLATFIVLPTAIFLFVGGGSYDFLELGTELLPLAIISGALWIFFSNHKNLSTARLALGSGVIGVSIWAKPQVGLLGVCLIASCIILRMLERTPSDETFRIHGSLAGTWRDSLIGLAAFLTPTILIIAFLAITGELHNFKTQGIPEIFNYVAYSNSAPVSILSRVQSADATLVVFPFAFLWAIGGLLGWENRETSHSLARRITNSLAWSLPIFGACITLLVLTKIYTHYLNILFAASMISAVVGARIARIAGSERPRRPSGKNIVTHVMGIALIGVLLGNMSLISPNIQFVTHEVATIASGHSPPTTDGYIAGKSDLSRLCPPNSHVFVWGWANELYSYYNWVPASQYVNAIWSLGSPSTVSMVGSTIAFDFSAHPPKCIVEAIGPVFFGGLPITDTILSAIPQMTNLIPSCYRKTSAKVGTVPNAVTYEQGQTVNLYVRRNICELLTS